MTDELNITVCGECTRPLVIEDGAARELTDAEARSIAGDDVLISALGLQAAFSEIPWRCEGCGHG